MSEPRAYEFDDEQNATIGKLARAMQTVGLVMMVFGVIGIAGAVVAFFDHRTMTLAAPQLIEVVVLTLFGYWTRNAGNAFDAVVQTSGADMKHLMTALRDLGKMYGLIRGVILFCVCLFLSSVIVMAVGTFLFAPHR